MAASYHTHTTWSDGKGTVAEMVAAAEALGLEEVGISDHFVVPPLDAGRRWAMDAGRLDEYVAEVRAAAGNAGLPLRLGLEVDWFPEHAEVIAERLRAHAFDYLIGSVHEVDGFRYDVSHEDWDALTIAERDEKHRVYWRRITSLAESRFFDVVGHLDLPKKFRQWPTEDISAEVDAALDALVAADVVVELNTSGWFKPCEEQYPSEALLRACQARGIAVVLSADAHRPEQLNREYVRGAEMLRICGYRETVRFEARERRSAPI